jgi:hypothetical protein
MTLPDSCAINRPAAARQPLKTPIRLTSTVRRNSSGAISATGETLATPELLTRTSSRPSSAAVRVDERLHLGVVRHVGRHDDRAAPERPDLVGGLLELGHGARRHRHIGTGARQRQRHGAPSRGSRP